MKKIFIFFLCCSTLLQGCYSYSSITREDWLSQSPSVGENIFITLVDDSVIKSKPYHHIYTTEPANFIFGTAKLKHRYIRREHTQFVGKLERSSVDSLKTIGVSPQYLICYLPDSTDIYYQDGDYVIITPDQLPGLWCSGILTVDDKESIFSGRIPNESIKYIEIKKFDPMLTTAFVICVIGITFVVIAISYYSDFKPAIKF